jgi:hypothetical protein
MLAEALSWLAKQTSSAQEPITLIKRDDVVMMVNRDLKGERTFSLPVGPRNHTVATLQDFVTACGRWGGARSVVLHSLKGVLLLIDDSDRRDRVFLPLETTEVFDLVLTMAAERYDQRTFVGLLRRDLCKVIPSYLVTAIAKIEVVTNSQQRTEVNPGRERGTREFAADLAMSGEIPERVKCYIPVYRLDGLNQPMEIEFSLDYTLPPMPVSFSFRTLPDEIENVQALLQGTLHQLLETLLGDELGGREDVKIDVLYGDP